MLQGCRQRHGSGHCRYRARTTGAAACPTRRSEGATSIPAELIQKLRANEQAAYDAHSAAREAWRAAPDSRDRQARLIATFRAWQAAHEACQRAQAQKRGPLHTSDR